MNIMSPSDPRGAILRETSLNEVALHGFIKKSQRTPKDDLDVALKRKKELDR